MKKIITGIILTLLAINASASNNNVAIDIGGQKNLANVNHSGNFDKFTKKTKTSYYRDSGNYESNLKEVSKSSLDDIYLEAGIDMDIINQWRAEAAEIKEAERKLAEKPNAAIGMTKSQVRNKTNWGNPNYINTTTNKHGSHEQWVYDDHQYLYFDNGKLTTIQQ